MNELTTEEICTILTKIKLKREVRERLRALRADKAAIDLQIDAAQQELTGLASTQAEEDVYDAIVEVLDNLG
jgi:hypothetical protein